MDGRLTSLALFQDIPAGRLTVLLEASGASVVEYRRGEVILMQGDVNQSIYAVIEGMARGSAVDENGEESTVGLFSAGELFGEILSGSGAPSPVTVVAVRPCTVLCLPFAGMARCGCVPGGEQLIRNLFLLIANKYFVQRRRLEILCERSIRGKLLAHAARPLTQLMTHTELAEYLCCDRSAMMRELSSLLRAGTLCEIGGILHFCENEQKK